MAIKRLTQVESLWALWILLRDHWGTALAFLAGGGGMTYLVAVTEWVNAYGPVAWGVAFFIGAYAALGVLYLWKVIASRALVNRQLEITVNNDGVNPRAVRFERQSVSLGSFFSPFYYKHKNKDFIDSDLFGPAMIHLDGCTLDGVEFRHCQIVIIRLHVTLWGIVLFQNVRFLRGTMSNLTLVMDQAAYDRLPKGLTDDVPVMHKTAD